MKKLQGFTLAEVLITLGIIGVVAAMTIPTLINNYQKQQYVNALKKAYTTFNQTLVQLAADNGCVGDLKCTGFFDSTTQSTQTLGDNLVRYFNVVKNCQQNTTGCFPDNVSSCYTGSCGRSNTFDNPSWNYRFITADGMSYIVKLSPNNCENNYSSSSNGPLKKVCGEMYVAVNSLKGPSNMGRDVFHFYITNNNGPLLYPVGTADDNYYGSWRDAGGNPQYCTSISSGDHCSGRIVDEGWQMNY